MICYRPKGRRPNPNWKVMERNCGGYAVSQPLVYMIEFLPLPVHHVFSFKYAHIKWTRIGWLPLKLWTCSTCGLKCVTSYSLTAWLSLKIIHFDPVCNVSPTLLIKDHLNTPFMFMWGTANAFFKCPESAECQLVQPRPCWDFINCLAVLTKVKVAFLYAHMCLAFVLKF